MNPYNPEVPNDLEITLDRGIPTYRAIAYLNWVAVQLEAQNAPSDPIMPILENSRVHFFNAETRQKVLKNYPDVAEYEESNALYLAGSWHCDDSFAYSEWIFISHPDDQFPTFTLTEI